MSNTAYIGYDLGDGETITDFIVLARGTSMNKMRFSDMQMPDQSEPGKAIPTALGYDDGTLVFASSIANDPQNVTDVVVNFKRRPTDLIEPVSEPREDDLIEALRGGWGHALASAHELDSQALREFADAVQTFTNGIFEDEDYKETVRSMIIGCDEIVFCVGHPTRWNRLDIAIYDAILRETVLGEGSYAGKPSTLHTAAESRAAFLYAKNQVGLTNVSSGKATLLIDVGSSTIDITAIANDSHNTQYNTGNNYLGARCIDVLLRDWYLDTAIRNNPRSLSLYEDFVSNNPSYADSVLLICRLAKENTFSSKNGKGAINVPGLVLKRFVRKDLEDLIRTRPIAQVLTECFDASAGETRAMGSKSWATLFAEFLAKTHAELRGAGVETGRIIFTGSASKMPIVKELVAREFDEVSLDDMLRDMVPSRTISKGLALVGPSSAISEEFEEEIRKVIDSDMPKLIEDDIEVLAEPLSQAIESVVREIAVEKMVQWRDGKITTLDKMKELIKKDCTEDALRERLKDNEAYNEVINDWLRDVVGRDIAIRLKDVCSRFGVSDISVNDLNVFKVPQVSIGGNIDGLGNMGDVIAALVGLVAGIIAYSVVPVIIGVVLALLVVMGGEIAVALAAFLLTTPAGTAVLVGIVGAATIAAFVKGTGSAKKIVVDKIQGINLPEIARKFMTNKKIDSELDKQNIAEQIRTSLLKPDSKSKKKLVEELSASLSKEVAKRADAIKYAIIDNN